MDRSVKAVCDSLLHQLLCQFTLSGIRSQIRIRIKLFQCFCHNVSFGFCPVFSVKGIDSFRGQAGSRQFAALRYMIDDILPVNCQSDGRADPPVRDAGLGKVKKSGSEHRCYMAGALCTQIINHIPGNHGKEVALISYK